MNGIDAGELKTKISIDIIKDILSEMGSDEPKEDGKGNLLFQTVCHGGDSHKLYYFTETCSFHCFTQCGESYDIFSLLMKVNDISFAEAVYYVANKAGIQIEQQRVGFVRENKLTDDWDLLDKYDILKNEYQLTENLPAYDENILTMFVDGVHSDWIENDGITPEAASKFEIKFDEGNNKIIIPHRDMNGNLVGIRSRNLGGWQVNNGLKYTPLMVQNITYAHPTGNNIYGLFQNLEQIAKIKKLVLFEGEKSVIQCESFYPNSNFTGAVCGSSITRKQIELVLSLGINEVFIAFDKEFDEEGDKKAVTYSEKILNIAHKFSPYLRTYVLWDSFGLLSPKDSPTDKGKDVFEILMTRKYEVESKYVVESKKGGK